MSQPMMWVFAVLVVAAMGGVAMLAAGHGEPMEPAFDDRPDAVVPRDRPIGAADLRRVRFPLAFRGYRMAEVDALLSRVAAEMEAGARGGPWPVPSTTTDRVDRSPSDGAGDGASNDARDDAGSRAGNDLASDDKPT